MIGKTTFYGDANLGLYGFATEKYCLLGVHPPKKVHESLEVKVITEHLMTTQFGGIFAAGNSEGIVIPAIIDKKERVRLEKHFEKVLVLKTDFSALGNLILMNDNGIIISPLIKKYSKVISNEFKLPCKSIKIAGSTIVGKVAFATNKGFLSHPKTTKRELARISEILGVPGDIGTVNFGSPFVGSGIIANSKGFIAGEPTSGPELGRIAESLGFV